MTTVNPSLIGYGVLILASIGIPANMIVVAALTRNAEISKHFFNWLLTMLIVIDTFFLACGMFEAIRLICDEPATMTILYVAIIYPICSTLMFASISMTVLLAYERYKAVTTTLYEGNVNNIPHPWLHLMRFVTPVIGVVILYTLPKFWELELDSLTIHGSNNSTQNLHQNISNIAALEIVFSPLRLNRSYVLWYITIGTTLMTNILPLSLLVYFNSKIYFGLKRFSEIRRHLRTDTEVPSTNQPTRQKEPNTTVLLVMICMYLSCNILRLILNISEMISYETQRKSNKIGCFGTHYWMLIATIISTFLVYLNPFANLFAYVIANSELREILITTMIRPAYECIANNFPRLW